MSETAVPPVPTWASSIDAIEAGYEYMLAYAAQGLEPNQSGAHEAEIRTKLSNMAGALEVIPQQAQTLCTDRDAANAPQYAAVLRALAHDAEHAAGAIQLVLTRTGISSQLIDNLNASSHIRALLTDLFLIDEALNRG